MVGRFDYKRGCENLEELFSNFKSVNLVVPVVRDWWNEMGLDSMGWYERK